MLALILDKIQDIIVPSYTMKFALLYHDATIHTFYVTFPKYLRDITYYSEFTDKRIYVALHYYIQFLEHIK